MASALITLLVSGQTINFTLKEHANKVFTVSVSNGLHVDTISRGQISILGDGRIVVPSKYKGVPVMGTLSIDGAKPVELIFNNEDFSFHSNTNGRFAFDGSTENDLLHNRPSEVLADANKDTYVYAYVKILNSIVKMSKAVQQQQNVSLFDKTSARLSVLNDVDVDKLYYSRFWFFAIDGLLRLSNGQEGFAQDMIRLIDKTKTDKVFVALVEDAIVILNQYGLDDAFDIIIPHVQKTGRIEYPQGNIYDAFAMAKVTKGSKAPEVVGLKKLKKGEESKYTLLVFHQPGCENCHEQLAILGKKYDSFQKLGVRVVSISGALDKKDYQEEAKAFLWNDKLCDFGGFAGANFQNYGVIATPTLYLLDESSTVLGRFAKILDVETFVRGAL